MSSTGSGYDYSCGTFSPDGRIFQVEYAQKAVENSGTAIGIKCCDGIVLVVEKPQVSKMLVAGSNRRAFGVDSHVGMVVTGLSADGRQLVNRAREESQNYRDSYGSKIVPSILVNRLSMYVHYFTLHSSLRPFGSVALFAAYDEDLHVPELYMVEPSGNAFRFHGCAAGKGAQAAKTELEKILAKYSTGAGADGSRSTLKARDAVKELARIIYTIRDVSKDKPFELEMAWLCEESKMSFSLVPKDLVEEADTEAKNSVQGTEAAASAAAAAEPSPPVAEEAVAMSSEEAEAEGPPEMSPMDI